MSDALTEAARAILLAMDPVIEYPGSSQIQRARRLRYHVETRGWEWTETHYPEAGRMLAELTAGIGSSVGSERSSRQAWAEEADAVQQELEHSTLSALKLLHQMDTLIDALYRKWGDDKAKRFIDEVERNNPFKPGPGIYIGEDGVIRLASEPTGVCACLTDEDAAVLAAGGFSLPVCAIHRETRRATAVAHEDTSAPDLFCGEEPEVLVDAPDDVPRVLPVSGDKP